MTHLRLFFIVGTLCLTMTGLSAATIVYTVDSTTNFCNPERGFYHHMEQKVKSTSTTNLSKSTFTEVRSEGHTLLLRMYYLDNFRTKDLPQSILNLIEGDFALFRQYGCKAVLRFAYDNDNDDGYQDATPARWKSHLAQLKPILQANADVIAVVQAGFMGAWGEWYFSSQGEGSEIPQKVKNNLIDQLLDAVPASRCVQLRTPDYKRDYFTYRKESTAALTAAEAYTGTARARLGHHNDAFLYQSDNMGTYSNRTVDMNYLDQECMYLPNGGETDVYKESVYKDWATGDKAQAEMAKLHYSYLNQGYAELTLNHWRQDGSFAILERKMGYRFQLLSAELPDSASTCEWMPVRMQIQNIGYAPLYNERHAYLVFKNANHTYSLLLCSNPRTWAPNGVITTIDESIKLPANMQPGTYQLYLHLPDASASIAARPEFAIRLGNTGLWDEKTGYNALNATIRVGVGTESSLTATPSPVPVHKFCRDGQIYIQKGEKIYNNLGQIVK